MDPFSATIGAAQIAGQCAQAIAGLVRYVNQVATVDIRIRSFHDEVVQLQRTNDSLQQCRNAPQMIAAAKAADTFTQNLWSHLATTLRDCENTLIAVNDILSRIDKPLGLTGSLWRIADKPVKQLREQLNSGDLGRHQEKIKMFNNSLQLPLQMIQITLQLNQRDISIEHQRQLESRLSTMQRTIDLLNENIRDFKRPRQRRSSNSSSITLVGVQKTEETVCNYMESFARTAKHFLSTASTVAGTRSSASTVHLDGALTIRGTSEAGRPLTQTGRDQIESWMTAPQERSFDSPAVIEPVTNTVDTDQDDYDLEMVRVFLEHGQADFEQEKFAEAEENFTEALELLQVKDFGELLAFQSGDVVLMLAQCYVQQGKLEPAIELLLPLTTESSIPELTEASSSDNRSIMSINSQIRPDYGRILAAHHILGTVYLRKQDYANAETHSMAAFMGRKRIFGLYHEKFIESAQLVVDVYTAMGKMAKARANSKYLVPARQSEQPRHSTSATVVQPSARPGVPKLIPLERSTTAPAAAPNPPSSSTTTRPPTIEPVDFRRRSTVTMSTDPPSIFDDVSEQSSITRSNIRRTYSTTPRNYIKSRMDNIKETARISKSKACTFTENFLKGYEPTSRILLLRWSEIKKNIEKQGAERGLAATGYGYAPIHFFCELTGKDQSITEVSLLIEEGVDLMAVCHKAGYRKEEPMIPLQIAIERGHQLLATMLINALHNAGLLATQVMALKDREELSPLLAASRRGQIDTVTRFLEYDARVVSGFPRFWCGNSLLHDAASRCNVDLVKLLLGFQTNSASQQLDIGTLNQQDQFGRTPLMYAVISRNIADTAQRECKIRWRHKCVQILIASAGSELDRALEISDTKGMNVLAFARDEGDFVLIELLQRHGAGVTAEGSVSDVSREPESVDLYE